jgi:hypothetical protein
VVLTDIYLGLVPENLINAELLCSRLMPLSSEMGYFVL